MEIGLANIQNRAWELAAQLREQRTTIAGAQIHDVGSTACAIVSFTIQRLDSVAAVSALHAKGINIGVSGPESTLLDAQARNLPVLLRAAPHYFNTEDETAQALSTLQGQELSQKDTHLM